jgi:hypothetical protein
MHRDSRRLEFIRNRSFAVCAADAYIKAGFIVFGKRGKERVFNAADGEKGNDADNI